MRNAIPAWMRTSAQVDLAQLRRGLRQVIRSQVEGSLDKTEIRRWARRNGFFAVVDKDGFFALSRSGGLAARALRIDASPGNHTIALGRALGYPLCCCRAAGRCGDHGLDCWAKALSSRRFVGLYRLIDPGGYVTGKSNISHVPCSPYCDASLKMALAFVEGTRTGPRKRWHGRNPRPSRRAGRPAGT